MENILFLAVFLSGAASLVYELLWFRLGGLVFGNSVWAASLVLASFMGGLALGNAAVAAAGHRLKAPLRWYAFFEVVIGLTGLLLVCGFSSFTQIGAPLFRRLLDHPLLLNVLRTTSAFSLMVVPTSAMGATLPLLVKAFNRRTRRFGRALGLMYGWNTFGAFAGVILAETFLVRWFGLRGTGAIACGANLTAASLALIVAGKSPDSDRTHAEDGSRRPPGGHASPRIMLLAGAGFATGFAFLALEVVWLRFLLLFFSAYALYFALILAAVLAGISFGGLLTAGWIGRRGVASRWAGPLTLLNAVLLVVLYAKFGWTFRLYSIMPVGGLAIMLYDCLFLIFPIAFLSGIIFTMLGRLLHDEIGVETAAVGLLTVANTSQGGMFGALTAGFIGIPLLGVERSFSGLGRRLRPGRRRAGDRAEKNGRPPLRLRRQGGDRDVLGRGGSLPVGADEGLSAIRSGHSGEGDDSSRF